MPYAYPDFETLIAQALNDLSNQLDFTPLETSNEVILAYVNTGLVDDQYKYLDYIYQQSNPFTATNEFLAAWAALKGIVRIPASFASGTVAFTGTSGSVVPAGVVLVGTNQQTYTTQAEYIIGTSSPVTLTASQAGVAGNANSGMALTLVSALTGVQSGTTAATEITGGVAVEADSRLRRRMLLAFAQPAQGGSESDYVQWSLAVPGVTRAWALGDGYPTGVGGVTVFPMFDTLEGMTNGGFPVGSDGVATGVTRGNFPVATGDQLAVANYIQPLRPVTALIYVQAPQPQYFSVTVTGLGITNSWVNGTWTSTPTTLESDILASIQEVLIQIGTALGGTVPISALYSAIGSVSGVSNFTITYPTDEIITLVGNLPVIDVLNMTP